ncbi:hypothetical protein Q5692_33735 [Microcoleus sp. C2C3]|uniref:hypothetical protein n=1 Tax=unclassified Microcoleus TaxID=2642155 RepID=UPI002FD2FA72
MPSTFECPFCKSRYNRWVASTWDAETNTDITTYQCKKCLNLFEHKICLPDTEDEADSELILEM